MTAASHWAELACSAHGRRLVVLDDGEVTGDLVRDMIEVLTAFCVRLYGRRAPGGAELCVDGSRVRPAGHRPQAVLATGSAACGDAG